MRFTRLAICALILAPSVTNAQQSAAPAAAQKPDPLADLSGLWHAKKWFDPEARGELVIERTGDGLRAEIAGHYALVSERRRELAFKLTGDRGEFSGRLEPDGAIRGDWIRPATALSYGRASSPVVLKPIGKDRWSGLVDPGEEEFSFYIFAHRASGDTYDAVLRNPEFDLGNQQGVNKLVREGDVVRLIAKRGDRPERTLASGTMQPDMEGFSLTFSGRGGTYDFSRDDGSSLVYPRPRPGEPY